MEDVLLVGFWFFMGALSQYGVGVFFRKRKEANNYPDRGTEV